MAKEGWVSMHRKIQEHWIWQDANKFKWWVDILLTVNNAPAKVNIGNEIYECKRGESLLSLKSWSERWNVSKDTARNFLTLLEKDSMITRVNCTKTTRITVCNYDSYQTSLHVNQTPAVRKPNANQTQTHPNNNDNNEYNDNKTIPTVGLSATNPPVSVASKDIPFADKCGIFINLFNSIRTNGDKPSAFQATAKVKEKLKARLKTYSSAQIKTAIEFAVKDKFHIENNFKHVTPEYVLREETLEKYLNTPTKSEQVTDIFQSAIGTTR